MTRPRPSDVCLVLEGTYPYVRGGVSAWVHNLIRGLPELSFSLLAVSPTRRGAGQRHYQLPANVVSFAEVYIHELADDARLRRGRPPLAAWRSFERFCRGRGPARVDAALALLRASALGQRRGLTAGDVLASPRGWELLLERYQADAPDSSFIDYFWTWRSVHAPLFQTMVSEIPPARVYHAVSTGYAGLLGAIAKLRSGRPLVLTEHGLYVRERCIEIARAEWLFEEPVRLRAPAATTSPLKAMWIDLFVTLARLAYAQADEVVSLFAGNQQLQRQLGADPARCRVIPNGVAIDQLAPLAQARRAGQRPLRVGFVGRVVPIKDIKTLLRAFDRVRQRVPGVELWIVGPLDEDPQYAEECRALARVLDLPRVRFTGPQDVRQIYPEIDVLVLTSLSEGQPLVILEAACAGVPSVATDVGDCRGLIEGADLADRALGAAGIVTRLGDPADSARALVQVLESPELQERMSRAGMARARRFYREELVSERYRELYRRKAA